jgi:hypothetical protein
MPTMVANLWTRGLPPRAGTFLIRPWRDVAMAFMRGDEDVWIANVERLATFDECGVAKIPWRGVRDGVVALNCSILPPDGLSSFEWREVEVPSGVPSDV